MTFIEIDDGNDTSSFRQRWNHYLVLAFGVIGLMIGLNLRDSALNATTLYTNVQAGISASYPENWLLDEDGDYIFRVRDASNVGFKTTIQVAARPVSASASTRSILDSLTLNRAQTLAAYTVLSERPYTLPDEVQAVAMAYTFVSSDPNPFLQGVPVVVEGLDILTIQRGQAIIVTFLSDSDTYAENLPTFNRFINNLEF
ncbi:MAG: hypothetical protein K8L99_26115 [Anaerolineae bacterium]|nr:hypothetical protein [Anaerolineae bacterium]